MLAPATMQSNIPRPLTSVVPASTKALELFPIKYPPTKNGFSRKISRLGELQISSTRSTQTEEGILSPDSDSSLDDDLDFTNDSHSIGSSSKKEGFAIFKGGESEDYKGVAHPGTSGNTLSDQMNPVRKMRRTGRGFGMKADEDIADYMERILITPKEEAGAVAETEKSEGLPMPQELEKDVGIKKGGSGMPEVGAREVEVLSKSQDEMFKNGRGLEVPQIGVPKIKELPRSQALPERTDLGEGKGPELPQIVVMRTSEQGSEIAEECMNEDASYLGGGNICQERPAVTVKARKNGVKKTETDANLLDDDGNPWMPLRFR